MVFRLEIEYLRLAVVRKRLIVFLTAGEQIVVRQVRKSEHDRCELRFDKLQALVDLFGFCGKLFHFGENSRNVLPFFLVGRDQLVVFVLLCLDSLGFGNQASSFSVQRQDLFDVRTGVFSLFCKSCNDLFGFFFDITNVQHIIPLSCGY